MPRYTNSRSTLEILVELARLLEINHNRTQLSPICQQYVQEALDISVLQPVPVYAGKSFKQKSIDLVHPLLNAMHSYWYTALGWDSEVKLRDIVGVNQGLGERLDFARKLPNEKWLAIEVQFGNGGRLEKDFSKMRELHTRGLLELGILVYFTQETADTADSGLASFEKVLQYKHLFEDLPVLVVGLSRKNTPVLDLAQLRQIPFPQVMGGKGGKDAKKLHKFLAYQIAHGVAVSSIELDDASQEVVRAQARKHVQDIAEELHQVLERIEGCQDATLRNSLFGIVAGQFKLFEAQAQELILLAPPQHQQTVPSQPAPGPGAAVTQRVAPTPAHNPVDMDAKRVAPASHALLISGAANDSYAVLQAALRAAQSPVRIAKPVSPLARPRERPELAVREMTLGEKNAQLRARWQAACANRRYPPPVVTAMQAAFLKVA